MSVVVPALTVAPILLGDLEALEDRLLALLETLELGFLVDGQPELHHHDIGIDQLLFEVVDFRIGAQPLIRGTETFHSLDQYAAIPRAIEYGELAALRHIAPEAP